MISPLKGAGSGDSISDSVRSTTAFTVETAEAILFDGTESASMLEIETPLVIVPPRLGRTINVMVPPLFAASVASVQVTIPLVCEQVTMEEIADTNVTFVGSVSVMRTELAAAGPRLVAVIV